MKTFSASFPPLFLKLVRRRRQSKPALATVRQGLGLAGPGAVGLRVGVLVGGASAQCSGRAGFERFGASWLLRSQGWTDLDALMSDAGVVYKSIITRYIVLLLCGYFIFGGAEFCFVATPRCLESLSKTLPSLRRHKSSR